MLYIFGGLPGVGKSTLARHLARQSGALYLRIDSIEQAVRLARPGAIGAEGYLAAQAVAADNLRLGWGVVADCVNPLERTRADWRAVAQRTGCPTQEIEVICSDAAAHRRRIEARTAPIPGLRMPTWDEVQQRRWEPWTAPTRLIIDTAGQTEAQSAADLCRRLGLDDRGEG